MTQKELLYLEDAISHEDIIISVIEDIIENLENEELVSFMSEEENKHKNTKQKLLTLMEEKANE